jgi:hypothetical protein
MISKETSMNGNDPNSKIPNPEGPSIYAKTKERKSLIS